MVSTFVFLFFMASEFPVMVGMYDNMEQCVQAKMEINKQTTKYSVASFICVPSAYKIRSAS